MEKLQYNRLPRLVANKKMGNNKITIGCHIIKQDGVFKYDFTVRKNGALLTFQPWEDVPNWLSKGDNYAILTWSEKFFADYIIAHWEFRHPLPNDLLFV